MQQAFHTRNYSIRDFEEWDKRGELLLQPKFQRRDVWTDKARSYLIDTILRGKPIPKVYMRQDVNPKTRHVRREIVDGQQRLRTVLNFLKDGFKISKSHHPTFGGKTFSGLDPSTQGDILKYEFVVDLLQDMPDNEVYNVLARINTYSEKLKAQERRKNCATLERKARMENAKEVLGKIADRVLAYRPKPKTKAAKRRKRRDQYAKRRRSESSI
jgi:hypothetical protein